MSYERVSFSVGWYCQWQGDGDVAVDSMVQQITPGVLHTVGGVRTNLYKGHLVLPNTFNTPLFRGDIAMEAIGKWLTLPHAVFPEANWSDRVTRTGCGLV